MQIEVVTDFNTLLPYKDRWNALVDRSETRTVYQTFEWHEAWWHSFGGEHKLHVVLMSKEQELVGIAPLMLTNKRVNGLREKVLSFIGAENYASDYCDFIVASDDPTILQKMLAWQEEHAPAWTQIDLKNLPSHSRHRTLLEDYCNQASWRVDSSIFAETPTRILGNRDDDLKAANKKSLKRHFNYFKRSGELKFRHCQSEAEILEHLNVFFKQHIERRAETDTPSQFLAANQRAFYERLVPALFSKDWLRFSVLFYNDTPIAFHFGFQFEGSYIWYKPAFDISYFKRSPGEVLLKYLLEYAIEEDLKEFDFTVGGEHFKYRFANKVRTNHRVRIFRRPISFFLARLRKRLGNIRKTITLKS
ncbi:GNAT family N-acetyltransferase [Oligoflexia bacterium]|nr:GNAT family N-acetyltransferase [Oligoflexia bacterium]